MKHIYIFVANYSFGIKNDAKILRDRINGLFRDKFSVRIIYLSKGVYKRKISDEELAAVNIIKNEGIAIFIESIPEFDWMFKTKIFIPNPEWTTKETQRRASLYIDIFLHKSKYSIEKFQDVFPNSSHVYLGFTSIDPGVLVKDYSNFSHFRGKSKTRNSQSILNIWQNNQSFPRLFFQAYGIDIGVHFNGWLKHCNLSLYLNYFNKHSDYFEALSTAGVHLCTSQMEGFGHYINESRAMAAFVVTINGSPMNELIDKDSGFLIDASENTLCNLGEKYLISEESLLNSLQKIIDIPLHFRKEMGMLSRERFLLDDKIFEENLHRFLMNGLGNLTIINCS
jgi:hypothetical protein